MSTDEAYQQIRSDLEREHAAIDELERTLERRQKRVRKLETALDVLKEYRNGGEPARLDDSEASLKDVVRFILENAGEPLQSTEVAESIWSSDFEYKHDRDTLDRSIRGILSRGVKSGDFVRVRRGVYGIPGRDRPDEAEEYFTG